MSSSVSVPELTIGSIHQAMGDGELTSVELVETYLDRIEAYDRDGPELTSVVTINPDAKARAGELDERFAELRGELARLEIRLRRIARTHEVRRLLMTVPGVAPVVAADGGLFDGLALVVADLVH